MNPDSIENLKKHLIKLDKNYRLGIPEISDLEYDDICEKYRILLSKYENKEKNEIEIPKWKNDFFSLLSTYKKDDIKSFVNKIKEKKLDEKNEFILQPKIDGISVLVIYREHNLCKAYTRGNTNNMREITNFFIKNNLIPIKIKFSSLEIRGELCITKKSYLEYVNNQEKSFVSERNLMAGILTRKNVIIKDLSLDIKFIIFEEKTNIFEYEKQLMDLSCYFRVIESKNYEENEILNENDFSETKKQFNCDGIVVKVNSKTLQKKIGYTNNHPKWAIALKNLSQEIFSKIIDISATVGKTGKISIIGIIEEKKVLGRKVNKILFHNLSFFNKLNIRKYDRVFFRFKGDSIAIFERHETMDKNNDFFPTLFLCPSCNQEIKKIGSLDYCTNKNCKDFLVMRIEKAAKNLDIESMGKKTAKLFVDKKYKNIFEIMQLEFDEIYKIIKKDKISSNLLIQLNKAKQKLNLRTILLALNIPGFGNKYAQAIFEKNINFDQLIEILKTDSEENEIKSILGTKSYQKIKNYFNEENDIILLSKKILNDKY